MKIDKFYFDENTQFNISYTKPSNNHLPLIEANIEAVVTLWSGGLVKLLLFKMMKFIYIFWIAILSIQGLLFAQANKEKSPTGGDCQAYPYDYNPTGGVVRQGDIPYEEVLQRTELNNLLNAKTWQVYTSTATTSYPEFFSPYFTIGNQNLEGISRGDQNAQVPFINYYNQGWRMITKKIGTPTLSIPFPYFVFYNIYTAKYRVFALMTQLRSQIIGNPSKVNNALFLFKFRNTTNRYSPNFFGEISTDVTPTTIEKDNIKEIVFPQFVINQMPCWVYAEFSVSYDPCACREQGESNQPLLDFELLIERDSNVKVCNYNNPDEQCTQILNPNLDNIQEKKDVGFAVTFNDENGIAKNAYNTSKDVKTGFNDFREGYEKAFSSKPLEINFSSNFSDYTNEKNITKVKSFIKKKEKFFNTIKSLDKILKDNDNGVNVLGSVLSGISSVYSIIKFLTGTKDEGGAKAFLPFVTNGTIGLKSRYLQGTFALPGTKQYGVGTKYKNLSGILTILEPPKVRYLKKIPLSQVANAFLEKQLNLPPFFCSSTEIYTTQAQRFSNYWGYDYYIFDDIPKIAINPALNIDLSQSEISVSYEFEGIDNIPNRYDKDLTGVSQPNYPFYSPQDPTLLYNTGELYAKNLIFDSYKGSHLETRINHLENISCRNRLFWWRTSNYNKPIYKYINNIPTPLYRTPYYSLQCIYSNRYNNAVYFRTMPSASQYNPPKVFIKVLAKLKPRNTAGAYMDDIIYVNRYAVNLIEDSSLENDPQKMLAQSMTDNLMLYYNTISLDYEGWAWEQISQEPIEAKETIDISGKNMPWANPPLSSNIQDKTFRAGVSIEVIPDGEPELSNVSLEIASSLNNNQQQGNCQLPLILGNALFTCSNSNYDINHYYAKPNNKNKVENKGQENKNYTLIIYPNPASQIVTFSYETEEFTQDKIYVTDMMGTKIADISEFIQKEKDKYEVNADVSTWTNGIYLVVLETKTQKIVKKLVITK